MGLCKCPKKKVTNQFCFEHRVNVCEHCMVDDHPTCIVQSYRKWLDDSDYNPVCRICEDQLGTTDCIRLVCYDVFHKECLNDWASRLPPNTAPAGYKCPVCSAAVFPASNLVSPIADRLREALEVFPWARTGLGLPLIEENNQRNDDKEWNLMNGEVAPQHEAALEQNVSFTAKPAVQHVKDDETVPRTTESHSRIHTQSVTNTSSSNSNIVSGSVSSSSSSTTGIRITATEDPPLTTSQFRGDVHHSSNSSITRKSSSSETRLLLGEGLERDADEDKYKRRSAIEWFSRWWRTMSRPSSRHHQSLVGGSRRMIMILVLLVLLTLIVVLSYFGRGASDDDPLLDPFNNPNIRIEDK